MLRSFCLLVVLALAGCAHLDAERLDSAWRAMPSDFGPSLAIHRFRPSELERVDYCAGVSVLRLRQEGVGRFVPLGVLAREAGGVVSSRKEWLAAPALAPDAAGWAFVAASASAGVLVIWPLYQFQEELWHAHGEVLHAEASAACATARRWLMLGGHVPVLSPLLEVATYYLDPREIKAKAAKILFFGAAPNLDSPAARKRYERLLRYLGEARLVEAGRPVTPPAIALEAEALRGASIIPPGRYWHPAFWPAALGPADASEEPRALPRIWR